MTGILRARWRRIKIDGPAQEFPAERIAVIKLGAIGDVVNSLPFVERLRSGYPEARITWVIAPLAHSLIEGHRAVDEFIVLDVRGFGDVLKARRALAGRRFDLAIDLQRIAKSGLLTRFSGAPVRLGFDRARCKELAWLFTNERIPANPKPGVTVAQYLEFADHLGLPPQDAAWNLPFSTVDWPGPPGRPRVVVNVGASKAANRWPVSKWAALCDALSKDGASVVLSGGPEDRETTRSVKAGASHPIEDRAGQFALKETAGLIAAADLFVGSDTGPLHIAVAVGTPVVALFGAADPDRTGPFGAPKSVVRHPTPCSPCRKRECTVAGHPCMTELTSEAVLARVRDVIDAG